MLNQMVVQNPRAIASAAAFVVGFFYYIAKSGNDSNPRQRRDDEDDDGRPFKIRREEAIKKIVEGEDAIDDRISEVSEHSGSSENSGEVYSDCYRDHPLNNSTPHKNVKNNKTRGEGGRTGFQNSNRNHDDSFDSYAATSHKNSYFDQQSRGHTDFDDHTDDDRYSYKSNYYSTSSGRAPDMKRRGLNTRSTKSSKILKIHRHFESSDAEFDSESTFPNSMFEGSDLDSHHHHDNSRRGKILYSKDGKRSRKLQYHSDFEVNRIEKSQKLRNKQKLIKIVRNEKELKGTDGIFFDIIGQYMKKGEGLRVNTSEGQGSSSQKR